MLLLTYYKDLLQYLKFQSQTSLTLIENCHVVTFYTILAHCMSKYISGKIWKQKYIDDNIREPYIYQLIFQWARTVLPYWNKLHFIKNW
jgi:hypothetical protein